MKQNNDGWVMPFLFSDTQRKELIMAGWRRSSEQKKAERYLDACQQILGLWLSVSDKTEENTAEDKKHCAQRIVKAAQELRSALNDTTEDVGELLDFAMDARIYVQNSYPEHDEAFHYLSKSLNKKNLNIYQLADLLDSLLFFLEDIATDVSNIKFRSGRDKGKEKWLVYQLADIYETSFGKYPPRGNGTCFSNFLAELSRILNIKIGESIRDEVLKDIENRYLSPQKNP